MERYLNRIRGLIKINQDAEFTASNTYKGDEDLHVDVILDTCFCI